MKLAIVYSSMTGNTKRLAEAIRDQVGQCYFGMPSDEALTADVIFIGFWAAKNSCGADIKVFIEKLSDKKIFLFGTAGYDNTKEYFDEILNSVKSYVAASNTMIGSYMCQGKVADAMQAKIKDTKPEMYESIKDKLAEAEFHPNEEDIKLLMAEVKQLNL